MRASSLARGRPVAALVEDLLPVGAGKVERLNATNGLRGMADDFKVD
jgi:hypothetical protein